MRRTIEEQLALCGRGFFQTVGDSMEPLLHNRRSTVVIEQMEEPIKRGDVVLYRRPAGEYVLHRVVKELEGAYLICGDNRIWREKVPADWIIGVMAGYYEDENDKYTPCKSLAYQRYLRTLKLRYGVLWLRALPRRIGRRLFRW